MEQILDWGPKSWQLLRVAQPKLKMTIKAAAIKVLRDAGQPLTVDQVYNQIRSEDLFEFKAQHPKSVLSRQLRKHCEGVDMKLGSDEKCFRLEGEKFALI